MLHVAGLSTQPARAVRKGVRPVLLLSVSSCQPGHSARGTDSRDWAAAAENETPDAGLAPARVKLGLPPYLRLSQYDIRVAWSRMLPGAAAAGSETADAGLALAGISFGPTRKAAAGNETQDAGLAQARASMACLPIS